MAAISLDAVSVRAADGTILLRDVSFDAADGELVVLVGPSGSGKSSVIRAVAGLEEVVSGAVRFDGVDVTQVDVAERDVGIVFQTQTLFPRYTARRNVGFPLRIRSLSEGEIRKRVDAEARALGIEHVLERWPAQLSAGHQQLVQIARALVRVPTVLLMDEPMAHLDPPTRTRLRHDLRELQQGYGVTTIYATNDPVEAMTMADRIVALDSGRVVQRGAPADLYAAPANTHIAWLTGPISFLDAIVEPDSEGFWLVGDGFRIRAWAPALDAYTGAAVSLGVRPEDVRPRPGSGIRAMVAAQSFEFGAPVTRLRIGEGVLAAASCDEDIGTELSVAIDRCLVFDRSDRLIAVVGSRTP